MEHGKLTTIQYREDGVDRLVLPIKVPTHVDTVLALDLTGLDESTVDTVVAVRAKYDAYVQGIVQSILSFDDWVKLTDTVAAVDIKYRRFKLEHVAPGDQA